jgi:hypothetical protein
MRVGGVRTPFHAVELGCKSVLDTVDVQAGRGPTADDGSRWETTFRPTEACGGDETDADATGNDGGGAMDEGEHGSAPAGYADGLFTEAQSPPPAPAAGLAELEAWALAGAPGARMRLDDALARFVRLPGDGVAAALRALAARGALRALGGGIYERAAAGGGGGDAEGAGVVGQLGRLRVGAGGEPSRVGCLQSGPGTELTVSAGRAAGRCLSTGTVAGPGAAAPARSEATGGGAARAGGGRAKKVSVVEEPLRNTRGGRVAKAPAARMATRGAAAQKGQKGGRLAAMRG